MSKPRKAKSETATTVPAADAATAVKPIPEAKVLAATTGVAASAIALFVLVTLPPVEKFEAGKGYWQIEIADNLGQRYSNVYRCTSLDKAKDLAGKMANERHIPIITKEPPPARTVTSPDPAETLLVDAEDSIADDTGTEDAGEFDDMIMPF